MRRKTYAGLLIGVLAFAAGADEIALAQIVGAGGAVGTSVNVQTLQTGTVLSVTPAVSADRRYVGMAVNPQFSSLEGIDTFVVTVPGMNGSTAAVGTVQAISMSRVPFRPAEIRLNSGSGGEEAAGRVTVVDYDKPLLAARVGALDMKNVTMKEATRKLADATKLNIVLGVKGLEKAGVDVNAKLDYSVGAGKSVREVLLSMVQKGAAGANLVIMSEDKVIQVMTEAQGDQRIVTKTYYLEDLLAGLPRFVAAGTNLGEIGTGVAGAKKYSSFGDMSRSIDLGKPTAALPEGIAGMPRPAKVAKAPARQRSQTNILEVITDTIRPEIWQHRGGRSEIYMVRNIVTVKAPASVHVLLDGPKVYNPDAVPLYINYAR